jgi:hypothetical protein
MKQNLNNKKGFKMKALSFLTTTILFTSGAYAGVSVNPNQRLECLKEVEKITTYFRAPKLCSGSTSSAPIDYFREVTVNYAHLIKSEKEALLLCTGAIDLTPIDCIEDLAKKIPGISGDKLSDVCAADNIDTKN